MPDSKPRPIDEDFRTDQAAVKRGGRPKVYAEPRVKASFWLRRSQLQALEQLRNDERSRLSAAGDAKYRQVSMASLVDEAITDLVAKKRRRK